MRAMKLWVRESVLEPPRGNKLLGSQDAQAIRDQVSAWSGRHAYNWDQKLRFVCQTPHVIIFRGFQHHDRLLMVSGDEVHAWSGRLRKLVDAKLADV